MEGTIKFLKGLKFKLGILLIMFGDFSPVEVAPVPKSQVFM
jgi:hypothetical protein